MATEWVDVVIEVLEGPDVTEEWAHRHGRARAGQDGIIKVRVEDRRDTDEGWACVALWAPGFGYGYAGRVAPHEVEGAAVPLP